MTSDTDSAIAAIFADLAQKFGLSRPAGFCFAAIWRAAMAPTADDLTQICGLSRSGVSVALKELRAWGLVDVARSPGNRRDFFVAPADPWEVARRIIAERQRRDLAPVFERLQDLGAQQEDTRLTDLTAVFEAANAFTAALARQDAADLSALMGADLADADDTSGGSGRKKKKKKKNEAR
ncbi:GbsR/MarR family transcriptional regulator [Albirhodobacter sp. R86504]|uniref:GbsR/MarR family transcriptional regulator n=1 Tax=Albirhodobacter sp. R86504 TaxID=3093848 RepID=UPI00366DB599